MQGQLFDHGEGLLGGRGQFFDPHRVLYEVQVRSLCLAVFGEFGHLEGYGYLESVWLCRVYLCGERQVFDPS